MFIRFCHRSALPLLATQLMPAKLQLLAASKLFGTTGFSQCEEFLYVFPYSFQTATWRLRVEWAFKKAKQSGMNPDALSACNPDGQFHSISCRITSQKSKYKITYSPKIKFIKE